MSGETLVKAVSQAKGTSRVLLAILVLCTVLALYATSLQRDQIPRHVEAVREAAAAEPARVEVAPVMASVVASCNGLEHTEMWGDVMRSAKDVGPRSPEECCAVCDRTRGCNVWVACAEEGRCQRQCWLKWQKDPARPTIHAASPDVPWTSGALMKDYDDGSRSFPPGDAEVIALRTDRGALRIRLRPDWSEGSVAYARRVAAHDLCTVRCNFYRAEPGFLLQGALHATIPANNETRTRGAGVAMERGDVAWAGGFAGPDFFIAHRRVPGFGAQHTVWGTLADEESLALLDDLVARPAASERPGAMRMLIEPITFVATTATPR